MISKLYLHTESPMVRFTVREDAERVRREHPFVPNDWNHERDPDRVFHLENGEWIPDLLMNDSTLGQTLRDRFADARIRDRAMTELLLTSGARLADVCSATLQGWAAPNADDQPFTTAMWVTNKGSRGVTSKKIIFSPETAALLRENFVEDHKDEKVDPLYTEFVDWAREALGVASNHEAPLPEPGLYFRFLRAKSYSTNIPLFLTVTTRKPYTPAAYRQGAWARALHNGASWLKIRPHQIRHWYVTLVLLQIEYQYRLMPAQRDSARQAFARYMGWKTRDRMLDVYDRALEVHGLANQWVLIAQFAEARVAISGTDLKSFLQEIDGPVRDEDAAPSVVRQTIARLRS